MSLLPMSAKRQFSVLILLSVVCALMFIPPMLMLFLKNFVHHAHLIRVIGSKLHHLMACLLFHHWIFLSHFISRFAINHIAHALLRRFYPIYQSQRCPRCFFFVHSDIIINSTWQSLRIWQTTGGMPSQLEEHLVSIEERMFLSQIN